MPAPAHLRITFTGVLGSASGQNEQWSCNLSAGAPGPDDPAASLTALAALATPLAGAWQTHISKIYTGAVIHQRCRVAMVDNTGHVYKTAGGAYRQADQAANHSVVATPYTPPQIALVATLLTGAAGSTGRGRFFIPSPRMGNLGVDGRLAVADRDAHLANVVAFINACNTSLTGAGFGRIVVASGGSVQRGVAPSLRPITHVAVGRVLDTQRRRREGLLEEKATTALPA